MTDPALTPSNPATTLPSVLKALPPSERIAFVERLETLRPQLVLALRRVYGHYHELDDLLERLVTLAGSHRLQRSDDLKALDAARLDDPRWFLRQTMAGYVAYTDRFAGTLAGVADHVDYLDELGVTYLHLMPLLQPRDGQNDGGYAVADYRRVDPRLGTMADLERLAGRLHQHGISLCIDLVVNHTAREHQWARAALAGDPYYRHFYLSFPDRTEPDRYEQTVRDVFPSWKPGNFTWIPEMDRWLWTTFWPFQWDLNYANPEVLVGMIDTLLFLANRGVDIFRLDAVPFMWKRMGTSCENQPEAHELLRIMRAITTLAAPGVVFKAEAIVSPDELVQYLGADDPARRECDLAYHNQLMVMLWSSLATRDVRLMVNALRRMRPAPPDTGWATYIRCHDDIGWAVTDVDAGSVGWGGQSHREFLSSFFSGGFPGSFARGALFQQNHLTRDSRVSGSAASLAGVEQALESGDPNGLDIALRRLIMMHAVIASFGGVPLVYMGDELALLNDYDFADDVHHADDNRWLHRPAMDWERALRRSDPDTVEGKMFSSLRELIRVRSELPALSATQPTVVLDPPHRAVLAVQRPHPQGDVIALANFDDHERIVSAASLGLGGVPTVAAASQGVGITGDDIRLPSWSFAWLPATTGV